MKWAIDQIVLMGRPDIWSVQLLKKYSKSSVNMPLPVKIIYLENLMLTPMDLTMKTVA